MKRLNHQKLQITALYIIRSPYLICNKSNNTIATQNMQETFIKYY